MKKKHFLLGLLFVLIAGGVAAYYLVPPWLAEKAWTRVAGKLSDKLGREVSAEDISFTPGSPLVIAGLKVAGDAGAAPLLRVDEVVVDVDAWSLVSGPIDVLSVRVAGPVVTVAVSDSGVPQLGDLPDRVRALLEGGAGDGAGDGGSKTGGGLRDRFSPNVPSVHFERGEVRLKGKGVRAFAALAPEGATLPSNELVFRGELTVTNDSPLIEEPLLKVIGFAKSEGLELGVEIKADIDPNADEFTAVVDGMRPFSYRVGERTLFVDGVSLSHESGVRLRGVRLTRPGGERPFFQVREVTLFLDEEPPEGLNGNVLMAMAARVGRVDLTEPELYFARSAEADMPLDDLEEKLYVDELDRRLEEDLEEDPAAPEPPPKKGQKRRLDPNGERVRKWVPAQFEALQSAFDGLTGAVRRFGSRLPVREIHVRKGRFLYEDNANDDRLSPRLYNFYLDAERRAEESVFAFEVHFETPDIERSKNRIEGKIHLETRDFQVQLQVDELRLERYRPLLPASLVLTPASAIHDTDLTLVYTSESEQVRAEGSVFLRDFQIHHPGVSSAPLDGLRLGAEFGLTVDFGAHRLVLDPSKLYLNGVAFDGEATVDDFDTVPLFGLKVGLPETDCQRLVDAIPNGLAPALAGVEMGGSFGVTLSASMSAANLNSLRYKIEPKAKQVAIKSMGDLVDLQKLRGRFRHRVMERDGTVTEFDVGRGSPRWVSLGNMTSYLVKAITTTEDGRFFRHDGFSPAAIRRSIIANMERGYFYRGASTISQQLVKNLYLSREKTISRKLQEAFITWQLEEHLSKERIIELYFNIIEWGPNIYGIKAAAQHYFGKRPSELTLLDTAFLVSIIPNPRRFYDQFERGKVTPRWRARIRRIVETMAARRKVSPAEAAAAAPFSPYFIGQAPPPAPKKKPTPPADTNRPGQVVAPADQGVPMPGGH